MTYLCVYISFEVNNFNCMVFKVVLLEMLQIDIYMYRALL